ncbi:MerR family transcriptional regulator [Chitinibacter sp. GC72]|uniref:MerR family transcriptional regulator n=1 Tax=Chitinibacter sp. GC72 TaxID=1526917 RepID=UPI0012FA9C87|nr:MerR family transcriptional regulator [Chitinibacter sp. GC72]
MYIGELAKLSGASAKAIRHYESLGLLGRVERQGVYRVYGQQDVQVVQWIKQAQSLGFRLAEIVAAFQRDADGQLDWREMSRQIELKRSAVQQEVARLQALEACLTTIHLEINECLSGEPLAAEPSPEQAKFYAFCADSQPA